MDIEIDHNPTPSKKYFISVGLNEKEAISFDCTTKGHRMIKQILIKKESHDTAVDEYGEVTAEWDAIVLKDRKFVRIYHVKWIDRDKLDTVNGETWETVWEKPISEEVDKNLLHYSRLVSDNYENLDQFSKEMTEFEDIISKEIEKYI